MTDNELIEILTISVVDQGPNRALYRARCSQDLHPRYATTEDGVLDIVAQWLECIHGDPAADDLVDSANLGAVCESGRRGDDSGPSSDTDGEMES